MIYRDRHEAAFLLAEELMKYKECDGVVVALPRGGVPIGFVIAGCLHLPLQVIPSKKIGHPQNKEYAIGALSMDGKVVLSTNETISKDYIESEINQVKKKLEQQNLAYNEGRTLKPFKDKVVIVVDDGLATGKTAEATIKYIKSKKPKELILAVPVAPQHTLKKLRPQVDILICLHEPDNFHAVGQYYKKFDQVEDYEVIDYLNRAEVFEF